MEVVYDPETIVDYLCEHGGKAIAEAMVRKAPEAASFQDDVLTACGLKDDEQSESDQQQ